MTSSKARDILDVAQFATDANIPALVQVIGPGTLELELVLRILLTYLPESIEPSAYVGLLRALFSNTFDDLDEPVTILRPSQDFTDVEMKRRLRKLHLLPLLTPSGNDAEPEEIFTAFLLDRSYRIDKEVGSLSFLCQLVEPFVHDSETIRVWFTSILIPLLRFDYEYYPQYAFSHDLESFESLRGSTGVRELMSRTFKNDTEQQEEPGRDLRGIVGPWIIGEVVGKQRSLLAGYQPVAHRQDSTSTRGPVEVSAVDDRNWGHVNAWILDLAGRDLSRVVAVVEQWDGPQDIDLGGWASQDDDENEETRGLTLDYAQSGMAAAYVCQDISTQTWKGIQCLISRAASLSHLTAPFEYDTMDLDSIISTISAEFISSISTVHLLPGDLLDALNPLTRPSDQALELAFLLVISARLLDDLEQPLALSRILTLSLFGLEADHRTTLLNILHRLQTKIRNDDQRWRKVRQNLLWLHTWNRSEQSRQGVLCRIMSVDLECELLKSLVISGHYKLAIELYCSSRSPPLLRERMENVILEVAMSLYDNASNGNKNRGGLKKVSDIISTFGGHFPESSKFQKATALVLATHSLSFYSLTLHHGVPFLPVNIRAHPSPLTLIDKVLSQNLKSYTKLDDLLEISRNLVIAGLIRSKDGQLLPESTVDEQIPGVERRVIAKAIEASLSEDDFDTAYSYVVNRLSSPYATPQDFEDSMHSNSLGDDVLWQAAYQAGRHRSKSDGGPSELRRLEQNMELLSQALQLAPPSALQELLATWRDCEANLNVALTKETVEEKRWNDKGDGRLPGSFTGDDVVPLVQQPRETTRKAMNEEAPMGLFDVARGAAAALSKSAFPLRDQRRPNSRRIEGEESHYGAPTPASPRSDDQDSEERVRKRDMVSNMVTGGLASGIGWVLGAPPARDE